MKSVGTAIRHRDYVYGDLEKEHNTVVVLTDIIPALIKAKFCEWDEKEGGYFRNKKITVDNLLKKATELSK